MALIDCQECGNKVSDTAAACPSCGAPVNRARRESQAAGTPLTTTQGTAKRFKLHQLLSVGTVILGVIMAASGDPDSGPSTGGLLVILIGIAWYIVTQIRIWWHHD